MLGCNLGAWCILKITGGKMKSYIEMINEGLAEQDITRHELTHLLKMESFNPSVYSWCSGQCVPNPQNRKKIAKALNLDFEDFNLACENYLSTNKKDKSEKVDSSKSSNTDVQFEKIKNMSIEELKNEYDKTAKHISTLNNYNLKIKESIRVKVSELANIAGLNVVITESENEKVIHDHPINCSICDDNK